MTKGGPRSRSGPLRDPNSARSDARGEKDWLTLPAGGRKTPAPAWPLTEATPRESVIWDRWWRKPEALIWELDGAEDYVALTVRMFSEAEVEKASAENRKTVRMMMADLYLTRDAKERARIKIAADETAAKRDEKQNDDSDDPRDRLTAVPDADAG